MPEQTDAEKVEAILKSLSQEMKTKIIPGNDKETHAAVEAKIVELIKGNEDLFLKYVAAAKKTIETKNAYIDDFRPSQTGGLVDTLTIDISSLPQGQREAIAKVEAAEKEALKEFSSALLKKLGKKQADLDYKDFLLLALATAIPQSYAAIEADKEFEKEADTVLRKLPRDLVCKLREANEKALGFLKTDKTPKADEVEEKVDQFIADRKLDKTLQEIKKIRDSIKKTVENEYKYMPPGVPNVIYKKVIEKINAGGEEQKKEDQPAKNDLKKQVNTGIPLEDVMKLALEQYEQTKGAPMDHSALTLAAAKPAVAGPLKDRGGFGSPA